jgi:hypothetical protein
VGRSMMCIFDTRWAASGVAPAGSLRPTAIIPVQGKVVRFAAFDHSLVTCMRDGMSQVSSRLELNLEAFARCDDGHSC